MKKRPAWILPIIIFSQFTGGSLWFASNAILIDIQRQWSLGESALGYMTSIVQLGFIAGTLCFAVLAVSDRFSPRKVFFFCSLLGAFTNLLIYLIADGFTSLMVFRGMTGFFLAGIYPVGMKIKYIFGGLHHHSRRQPWLHRRRNGCQKIRQCTGGFCSTWLFGDLLPLFCSHISSPLASIPRLFDILGNRGCWRFTPIFNPCCAHRS